MKDAALQAWKPCPSAGRLCRAPTRVELPFLVAAELVELGEAQQLAAGDLVEAEPVDEAHPHAPDERPDAAVVVVVRGG